MKQKLKKLIQDILFIAPIQRTQLLSALEVLSEDQLQSMYLSFTNLSGKEDLFLIRFFKNNPDFEAESQTVTQQIETELAPSSALASGSELLGKFDNLLGNP